MMIVFESVTKAFGNGTIALDSVSFSVAPEEFVVIAGHSGAGKSTIVKLLLKDTLATTGEIVVDGDDIRLISQKNLPLLRRKIGVVFQDFRLLFDKTVIENILLTLDILGINPKIAETRALELLTLTGLSDKGDHFPIQLSGGELQRVAIARALAPQPKIIFADEPTGNLDDATGTQIIDLLREINAQGTTVLMATHDHHLIKDAGLRTLHFEHGKLVKDISSREAHSKKKGTT